MTHRQELRADRHFRTTSRAVGVIFLAGMAVYVVGNVALVEPILAAPDHLSSVSGSRLALAVGALLMLLAAVGDTAHGILMLPVLRRHHERLAFGYFAARIIDAAFLALGVLLLLLQLPLGQEYVAAEPAGRASLVVLGDLSVAAHVYSYQIGMIAVGLAGLMLCSVLCRARLLPRVLAGWGLVGYAVLLTGSALEVLGFRPGLAHTVVGGLFELFVGVWLIAKGFSNPDVAAQVVPARAETAGLETAPARLESMDLGLAGSEPQPYSISWHVRR